MLKKESITTGRVALAVVCLTMCAAYSALLYMVPEALDDIDFRHRYLAVNGGSSAFSPGAFVRFGVEQWLTENGRLANMISPLFSTVLSRWASALLLGVMISAMVWMGAKVAARGGRVAALGLLAMWGGMILALPWWDNMMVIDYALNYPVAMLLQLAVLYGFAVRPSAVGRCGRWAYLAWLCVALAAGWSHEGFSVPMCAGMLAYICVGYRRMSRRMWVMAVVYGLGTMVAVMSPGIWSRVSESHDIASWAVMRHVVGTSMIPLVGLALMAGVMMLSAVGRGLLSAMFRRPEVIVMTVAMCVNAAVSIYGASLRGSWLADCFAVIVFFELIYHVVPSLKGAWRYAVAGCLYVALAALFGSCVYWQWRLAADDRRICSLLERSASGTVYFDCRYSTPWYTLGLPYSAHWRHEYIASITTYFDPSGRTIAVVPSCMARWDDGMLEPVDGDAGLYYYGPYLLTKEERRVWNRPSSYCDWLLFEDAGGVKKGIECVALRFYNSKGELWHYVIPAPPYCYGRYRRVDRM